MIGFITNEQIKDSILAGIDAAMDLRGLPRYWTTGATLILSGPHAGLWFIPADDQLLATPLHGRPVMTPMDFPETHQMLAMLGGLAARVDVDVADITQPQTDQT
jgi:hypothetical protein